MQNRTVRNQRFNSEEPPKFARKRFNSESHPFNPNLARNPKSRSFQNLATKHPEGTYFQFRRENESQCHTCHKRCCRSCAAATYSLWSVCHSLMRHEWTHLDFQKSKKHDMIIIRHDFTGEKYRTKRYVYYDWIDKRKIWEYLSCCFQLKTLSIEFLGSLLMSDRH